MMAFYIDQLPRSTTVSAYTHFQNQATKAIIERCKEQVQGNLVVVEVEMGGKLKGKKPKILTKLSTFILEVFDYLQS